MKARVIVTLKPGVLDPQGKAIEGALKSLGVAGRRAACAKARCSTSRSTPPTARRRSRKLSEACEKLLANTIVEDYAIDYE